MIHPSAVRTLAILSATCLVRLALAQEPEVILLDPNHPLIQPPGTIHPGPAPTPRSTSPVELVPLPTQGVNAREVFAGLWFRYRAFLQQGAADDASRQVESALDFMKREGLRTSPEIAGAFLAEARRALEEGDYRRSKEDYVLAAGFAAGDPAARFGLAWLLLRGDRDPGSALKEWWAGLRVLAGDTESLYTLAANGFLALFLGLGAGALTALALLSFKMAPAFFHDLQERSGGRLSEDGARLLGWALLALPAVAMLPLVWSVAAWAALFSAYLRRAEKLVAVAALLFLAATGPCAHLLSWQFGTAADPGARALIQWARRGPDLQQEEVLITLAKNHPQEVTFPFLLASAYRIAGRFDRVIDLYHDVLAIDPGDARA